MNIPIRNLLCYLFALWGTATHAQPAPTLDVLHYTVALDVQLKEKHLKGHTQVHFQVLANELRVVKLDLYELPVSRVALAGVEQQFEQTQEQLFVQLKSALAKEDTATLHITYAGTPATPSWFGGFYMDDTSAYNLGVWIDGRTPNFGKAWFPCVDNFTDKATYTFELTTPKAYTAVCSGEHQYTRVVDEHRHLHRWELRQPIATYLASVAVGNYVRYRQYLQSALSDSLPADVYIHPHQQAQAAQHFVGLQQVLTQFEAHFGAYTWPRVGYVAVAMQGGAMEHALNIAYPHSGLKDPSPALWIHELAHSWFGNYVTCKDAGEMWLNEGFARYCELLGQAWLRDVPVHELIEEDLMGKVLTQTHLYDGGYYAVAGVPPNLTYGSTVYDKGATVVHSLRGYLGDSVFFAGIRAYLEKHAWGNAGSNDLMAVLSETSGLDLSHFFDGWVYSSGFPHYAITDTQSTAVADGWQLRLRLRQDKWYKPVTVAHSRLHLRAFLADGSQRDTTLEMVGAQDSVRWHLPAAVQDVWLDPENRICDARFGTTMQVTGTHKRVRKAMRGHLDVASVAQGDTALLRLQRHWAQPPGLSGMVQPGWWTVQQRGTANYRIHLHYDQAERPKKAPNAARARLYHQPQLNAPWEAVDEVPFGRLKHSFELPGATGNYAIRHE